MSLETLKDRLADLVVLGGWILGYMAEIQSVLLALSTAFAILYYAVRIYGAWLDNLEKRRQRREQAERKTE